MPISTRNSSSPASSNRIRQLPVRIRSLPAKFPAARLPRYSEASTRRRGGRESPTTILSKSRYDRAPFSPLSILDLMLFFIVIFKPFDKFRLESNFLPDLCHTSLFSHMLHKISVYPTNVKNLFELELSFAMIFRPVFSTSLQIENYNVRFFLTVQ